jgi:hypothetical protein
MREILAVSTGPYLLWMTRYYEYYSLAIRAQCEEARDDFAWAALECRSIAGRYCGKITGITT